MSAASLFALIDGNNFYVSCERVFRPDLQGKPVIVLSNNDGCAVSRSDEAKALGIKMGEPYFRIRQEFSDAGIVALSSNYPLYGDMSSRMMSLSAGLGHRQEVYSIDESFIDLSGIRGNLVSRAQIVRQRIRVGLGLPTAVGIGPTKTLAKLANHIAKCAARKPGSYPPEFAHVCDLAALPESDIDALFCVTPVGEVWGIGRRIGAQLQAAGIATVSDFIDLPPSLVRSRWSVQLERTVRELQGQPCLGMDDGVASKKQIACTRSFGHPVTTMVELRQAVTEFSTRAAQKLRQAKCHAGELLVFIHTSPFRKTAQYSNAVVVPLRRPTADTAVLVASALIGLRAIYRDGYLFAKAGVMMLELTDASHSQGELDFSEDLPRARQRLMHAVDSINDRFGRGQIRLASAGEASRPRDWVMRQDMQTPRYTTRLADLPVVHA